MTQTAGPLDGPPAPGQRSATKPPRVAVIGLHGYGAHHVRHAAELAANGRLEFVAAADTTPSDPGQLGDGVQEFSDAEKMIKDVAADIVTIATPIHTHLPFAEMALRSEADVLLEKPPVTSQSQFDSLQRTAAETGRVVQVGFQSLGSAAIPELRRMMATGELGEISGISGVGLWLRRLDYWQRSPWAGKRVLDGVEVNDGVVTNPLAHATSAALAVAGADRADGIAEIEVELLHGNDIEADDTSVVRMITASGLPVTMALTLCVAKSQEHPYIEIVGTQGRARFFYTSDKVQVWKGDQEAAEELTFSRTSLLDNLISYREGSAELISPLEASAGFTRVMEAVRQGSPRAAATDSVSLHDDDQGQHVVIRDVEQWVQRAAFEHRTFSQLGAPFSL